MPKTYELSKEKVRDFGMLYLLERMVNKSLKFSVLLEGDDQNLEELLTFLMSKGYVDINPANQYVANRKGREVVSNFKQRYQDFLKNFDCYCAVDLEEGEFAFEEYWEYEDEDEWVDYLEQERWEDLRVAAAEFKGLDPLEIVFMGFLNEERINDKLSGWQFDLVLGSIWDELLQICNNALQSDDLAFEDDTGATVSGDTVMADILTQGADLNLRLRQQEEEYTAAEQKPKTLPISPAGPLELQPVHTPIITHTVYKNYKHDPRYVNPVWRRKYWDWD